MHTHIIIVLLTVAILVLQISERRGSGKARGHVGDVAEAD